MKKIFFALFFLFLFSLFSNPAFSQTGKIISWSFETNLGMDKDIKLEGSTPSHTFYLPNIPGGLWNQGILFLKVWFSEALNPESNISVYANDTLLSSHLLKNLNLLPGNIAFVEIPFSSAPISDGDEGVKIDIKPSLFISRNICEDLASGNLWMAIKKESFINLPTSPRDPQNISEFLRSIGNDFEIVLPPEEWSREIMHSYIMLYSFLRRTFRSRPFTIRTTTTPQQNTGSNPPPDQPKIFLLNNAVSDFQFLGKNLFLTTKGVTLLTSSYQKAMIARSGKIESQGSIPVSPRQKVTLSQLGVPSVHVQGIGDMKNTFFFSASELGGYPHQISFTLLENHTSMTQGSLTEAFLKVFFNQELVAVKKLEKDQVSEMTPYAFSIPSSLIRRDNEVQFIYSYYPEVSNCRQGTAPLEGFISGDSYIETWGKRKNPSLLTWHDVPIFFRGNGRIVFPSHPNRELLELSARLYASLREMDSDPFSFDLEVSIENPQNRPTPDQLPLTSPGTPFFPGRSMEVWHQLVQIPNDLQAYASSPELQNMNFLGKLLNIVGRTLIQYGEVTFQFLNLFFAFPQPTGSPIEKALPSPADYLLVIQPGNIPSTLRSPVIPTSGETILYHLANQRPVLKYSMDEPVGFLSVFWDKNQPVILYTTTGSDSVANENTRNFFLGASTIRSLNGNVTFFGRNGISDLTVGEDLQWNQTPTSSGTIFFENYKLFIYLGIFALIVVVCIYLAFKLSKPSLKNGR